MYKCGVTLINKQTGERLYFESVLHATCFLNRGNCYINSVLKYGGVVRHGDTGEEYDVIKDDPPKIGKLVVSNLSQAKMLDKSICNGCARSVGFCPWSKRQEPVKGWTAEDSYYEGKWYSFCVKDCPLFLADGETKEERIAQRKMLKEERLRGTNANSI